MDPTILGLILDSSMAIEAERQGLNVAEFLKSITRIVGDNEVALSSVTVAELAMASIGPTQPSAV
jgi:hypothetical protein